MWKEGCFVIRENTVPGYSPRLFLYCKAYEPAPDSVLIEHAIISKFSCWGGSDKSGKNFLSWEIPADNLKAVRDYLRVSCKYNELPATPEVFEQLEWPR